MLPAWLIAGAMLLASGPQRTPGPVVAGSREPRIVVLSTRALEHDAEMRALIAALREQSDVVVMLSGGAPAAGASRQRELLAMFGSLVLLATERRIVVGDGGPAAALMAAAGEARLAGGRAFPLVAVLPAREVLPAGRAAVAPHHSHVVAVDDPSLPAGAPAWGSETATMYWLFDRLAHGRSSVAVVAGGGAIALNEVAANVEAGRPILLIEGSGGAADALIALLRGTTPADADVAPLLAQARAARLARRRDVFEIVPIETGAAGLLAAMRAALGPALPRTR